MGFGTTGNSNTIDMSNLGSMSPTLSYQQQVGYFEAQDPEEQQRQLRYREKEDNRLRELQQKQVAEYEAKNERRGKARAKLEEMMKNSDNLKKSKAQERADKNASNPQNQGSWGLVVNSIALKNGDFPGTRDISRMRDAIVNKAKDGGSN